VMLVSGGQARSGWLSRMNRSSVDPDRLAVSMNTGDWHDSGLAAAPFAGYGSGRCDMPAGCHTRGQPGTRPARHGSTVEGQW
jgi:hypothetical protein